MRGSSCRLTRHLNPRSQLLDPAVKGQATLCPSHILHWATASLLQQHDSHMLSVPKQLIEAFGADKLHYQHVPAGGHRANGAEAAIRGVKNQSTSTRGIAGPSSPPKDWDLLTPHCEHTLNPLRPSKYNPRLSAWTTTHGQYSSTPTPIAPAGCKAIVHGRAMGRAPWADRGVNGPSLGAQRGLPFCRGAQ